ncbi:hypothetical protein HIM_01944 [Hirsutella minnesotensis 3608]|uniref:Ndc10 domain-containing protein n=1 Tax=Hirsutella minnesotensis 3608 TaxID=1043627 RepID=A0A0F7ZQX2_9HYPO|nr:hypothetical protein HIM_12205 [Hirsutella minnesotensis 3608]KJZ68608.1 hypothetical protein HIM_11996 [Hirsutella minnesotensis 3608]KJZ71673.1 hypothetical protein HIM_08934 [Hirsutella minnesotensis 3608]KJZ71805.1 hypothetical protein HIM_08825 [Hirsutella minnesotensis 3608]KJZ72355.1 hypothetical protein HIM_08281 [Hirsutella minnesotensis 3608]
MAHPDDFELLKAVEHATSYYLIDEDKTQPQNTRRTYTRPQKEWKEWCAEKAFPSIPPDWPKPYNQGGVLPADLVDEGKLVWFLDEKAVSRAPKTGSRAKNERRRWAEGAAERKAKKAEAASLDDPAGPSGPDDSCITVAVKTAVDKTELTSEDEEEPFKSALTLKFNTVRTYGNAITRLWAEQRTRRINGQMLNPSPHPRGFANKAIYRYLLRQTHEKGREEWADRMVGTIKDAYSPAKIPEHTRCAWGLKEKACGLRTSVDFLFGNHMLLRSSNRRPIELADCFCLECPNEGVKVHNNPTYAFVVVMNQGKTNQNGRIEYGACLRHRDPYACLVGQLAFWLFFRWQVEREPFPDFSRPEKWYNIKILRQQKDRPTAGLSYQTSHAWTRRLYSHVGIKTSKASHAPRVAATQNADMAGVPEAQIRRAGRWNMGDSMIGCYLTSLPYAFMRASADFSPEWAGSYFIPRSTVLPSAWLRSQIWPQADFWFQAFKDTSHEMAEVFENKATGAFIELLGWLRVVLLQDAPFLERDFPSHPIFKDPVFKTDEYKNFAASVLRVSEEPREDSQAELIQKAIPAIAEKVRGVEAGIYSLKKTVETEVLSLKAEVTRLKDEIQERNKAEITIVTTISPFGRTHRQTVRYEQQQQGIPTSSQRRQSLSPETRAPVAARAPTVITTTTELPPQIGLPRTIRTVRDLVRLWRHGLAGYMDSVDALEKRWGSQWRLRNERQLFSTRKRIVDEVVSRSQANGRPEDESARQLDEERGQRSLDWLFKQLKGAHRPK